MCICHAMVDDMHWIASIFVAMARGRKRHVDPLIKAIVEEDVKTCTLVDGTGPTYAIIYTNQYAPLPSLEAMRLDVKISRRD